jgi:hypothetical protein
MVESRSQIGLQDLHAKLGADSRKIIRESLELFQQGKPDFSRRQTHEPFRKKRPESNPGDCSCCASRASSRNDRFVPSTC